MGHFACHAVNSYRPAIGHRHGVALGNELLLQEYVNDPVNGQRLAGVNGKDIPD
jgi:hypothetical protein